MTDVAACSTLFEAAEHLRRPFAPDAVAWKLAERGDGIAVCFIDRGLVVDRLNTVVPDLWSDVYEQLPGEFVLCRLTIGERMREDVGQGRKLKARYSDALKRAAVKFGVGVSLSRVPALKLEPAMHAAGAITPAGLEFARDHYRAWLDAKGTDAFGEPVDHGDGGAAQGDEEDDENAPLEAAVSLMTAPTDLAGRVQFHSRVASLVETAGADGLDAVEIARALATTEANAEQVLAALAGLGEITKRGVRYYHETAV